MTKDRARKHAARQRAALTGERYVVAYRAVAEPVPPKAGRLHELTHRMPGVPVHIDGGLQRRVSPRNSRNHERQHSAPRVLVAWQNWIARRLGVDGR